MASSDADVLMSIVETVDEWEKGIQAFEAVATCPGWYICVSPGAPPEPPLSGLGPRPSTRSSLTSGSGLPHILSMRLLPLLRLLLPSSALPRTLPGRLMLKKRRKIHILNIIASAHFTSGIPFYINTSLICVTSGFGDLVFFDLELPLTLNCKICRYCQRAYSAFRGF